MYASQSLYMQNGFLSAEETGGKNLNKTFFHSHISNKYEEAATQRPKTLDPQRLINDSRPSITLKEQLIVLTQ